MRHPVTRCAKWKICFNPRICKRCDLFFSHLRTIDQRFNPRICKRCDALSLSQNKISISFNPRICKRCDLTYNPEHLPINVSIHASVKDATQNFILSSTDISSFNPRICKRCDFFSILGLGLGQLFQSTHL